MANKQVIGDLSEQELRELVPRLQQLTDKYKRSERIQKALYDISELSSSLRDFNNLYREIHKIVDRFMHADNFFVAFADEARENIRFAYYVDEQDEIDIEDYSYEYSSNGITAHILKTSDTLVITKENYEEVRAKYGFDVIGTPPVDLMGVPIKRDDEIIGAMVVQSYNDSDRYDADDLEILIFVSQHIVTARDRVMNRELTENLIKDRTKELLDTNTHLQEEISERTRIEQLQRALFEISELSSSSDSDMKVFYTELHSILKKLINAENCYIALLDKEEKHLSFPYFVGQKDDVHKTRKLASGLSEYVITQNKSVLVDEKSIHDLVESGEVDRKMIAVMAKDNNSWMGAPLTVDGRAKGIIALQTYGKGDEYTPDDLELLNFVSRHISVAIERREAAKELVKYNQQLSEKVDERTAELNRTNESLKRQIDQRKEIELKLIHEAHHDALTNLPNRIMFNSRLDLAIASKARYSEHNYALLFIDLDRFKSINDTLGHQAGDEFLIEASSRIAECKRGHDLLARVGGDEFVVLIDKFTSLADVEAVAQRIVDSLSQVFTIDNNEVFSGASIGIAEITSDYEVADDVVRDADTAMYQAKNLGRNRYVLFDVSMRNQLLEEIDDEKQFRKAFESNAFEYRVQAVKHLEDNSTLFYECSVYWPNNKRCKTQSCFWALADKTGLTYAINKALVDFAFTLLNKWQTVDEYRNVKVGLRLSIEHLLDKAAFQELVTKIEASDIYNDLLIIEFSEHSLSRFTQYLPRMLSRLRDLGVNLVLDNFASDTASLNHLFRYDFDYIKLNESLVNTFGMSDKYHRLVKSIIMIANEMGIAVIADGVNDEMIYQELIEVGCHFGQGSQISKERALDDENSF